MSAIKFPSLYLSDSSLDSHCQVIMNNIISMKLAGNMAQPGLKKMSSWIKKSVRTVSRCLVKLEEKGFLQRKRRGKKRTNEYFVSKDLWRKVHDGYEKNMKEWNKGKNEGLEECEGYIFRPVDPSPPIEHAPRPSGPRTIVSDMERAEAIDFMEKWTSEGKDLKDLPLSPLQNPNSPMGKAKGEDSAVNGIL